MDVFIDNFVEISIFLIIALPILVATGIKTWGFVYQVFQDTVKGIKR